MNAEAISGSLVPLSIATGTFVGMLPDISEVRKSVGNPTMIQDVRMGEATASVLVIGVGVICSSLTKSPVPAMVAIAAVGALVMMYEYVLHTNPKEMTHA